MINYKQITELAEKINYYEQQLDNLNAIELQVQRDGKGIHISVEHELAIPDYDSEFQHPFMPPQRIKPNAPYDTLEFFHLLINDIECLEMIYAIRIITQAQIDRLKRQLELITKEQ